MKKVIWGFMLCLILNQTVKGSNNDISYEQDWQSPEAIIATLYKTVSAGPGEERDWRRFRALFFQGAQFTMALEGAQGGRLITTDVEQMIEQTETHYKAVGFYEIETDQRVINYSQMANVYSSFEIKTALTDEKPLMRGLNHFQLLFDGTRWWVISNTTIIGDEVFELPVKH